MGSGYLLDSNVVIGYLDRKLPSDGMAFLDKIVEVRVNVSVITQIEVLRFNAPSHAVKVLSDFIDYANVCSLDEAVVNTTIAICKRSKIKLPDAIIAATAIVGGMTLLTRNVADFRNIDGLLYLNPWELPENI
jgi:predicted nucleic acid-binding protein